MKVINPKLKNMKSYNQFDFNNLNDGIYENIIIDEPITLKDIIIDTCYFKYIDFTNITFEGVEFLDINMENSLLCNKKFSGRSLERIIFKECKLMGNFFLNTLLENVQFIDCNLKYVNFSDCIFKNVLFQECNLSEGNFDNCVFKNCSFEDVNFTKTAFISSKLEDLDLASCDISSTIFDYKSIKGIIIEPQQSYALIGMLGVKLKI